MIKNIEQYLLKNYPVVWNVKIVPIGLLVVLLHILFFLAGYIVANPVAENDYFRSSSVYNLIYAGSVLFVILLFIYWLIQYNKHNGLRVYYPQSNISLYLEWLLIFVLCISFCFVSNSLSWGKETKWKTTISKQDAQKSQQIIERTYALLPNNEYNFEMGSDQTPLMVGNADVDRTRFDTRLFTYEESATTPEEPIEYIGPSLLYYSNHHYQSSDEAVSKIHQWLVAENKDSIRATIEAFLDLQKTHKLKTNVDVDTWMSIIYHPPLYPVSENNTISMFEDDYSSLYTSMNSLDGFYSIANGMYKEHSNKRWSYLIPIIIAMGLSVMVFSARATSGKSWVFALLSQGVLLFIFSLVIGFFSLINTNEENVNNRYITPIFWIGLFIILGVLLALKIKGGNAKERSKIYINLFIWYVPSIIPWLFYGYVVNSYTTFFYKGDSSEFIDLAHSMFVVNILVTLVTMFFIAMLVRKWKALPEG